MPNVAALSGNDTLVIDGHVFVDFADQNPVELTHANDIAMLKTGKNGNTLYALNETGKQVDMKLRIVRASDDDKFLLSRMSDQNLDFASFVLMAGTYTKRVGDGAGFVAADTYELSGGVFVKRIDAKMNVEGDTEQSVAIYTLKFSNAPRAIT
jgi:hypothetical protein